MSAAKAVLIAAALVQLPVTSATAEWDVGGSVEIALRAFADAPAYPGQLDRVEPSIAARPQLRYRSADGRFRFRFAPFGRYDRYDSARQHSDIAELSATWLTGRWEILAGVDKVFWGVAESRHLVDVINQTDLVEGVDEEAKLGQTMLKLSRQAEWGRLEAFLLPTFEPRSLPTARSRLRGPLLIDRDRPFYESGDRDEHVDFALRYSHFVGDWDIGLHWFDGTSREPTYLPASSSGLIAPYYQQISQLGLDLQLTHEAWLLKLETLRRRGHGRLFTAAVAGFEFTLFQVAGSDADLGIVAEFLYDGRDPTAPPTIFDRDIFVGARWAANDIQDTSVLAGVIADLNDRSKLFSIEAERRLGASWRVDIELRWLLDIASESTLQAIRRDSHAQITFSRHF